MPLIHSFNKYSGPALCQTPKVLSKLCNIVLSLWSQSYSRGDSCYAQIWNISTKKRCCMRKWNRNQFRLEVGEKGTVKKVTFKPRGH